ncbi:MAG: hypothetical protein E7774_16630 [Bradyrhizobium sp.]|nr:MAG: hypothetical protein E7774_16630 [Bradyrhizobium sp.]
MRALLAGVFTAVLLGGGGGTVAASQAVAPQAAAPLSAAPERIASGEGCAADIARYRAIQENDLSMGHVAKSVYNQIKKEIAQAEADCSAGRDAEAQAELIASHKRHGYPTDL